MSEPNDTKEDRYRESMYCPGCDEFVPENYDRVDEAWQCEKCGSTLFESKEEFISIVHGTARFQKEHGYGPWYDGETDD